MRHYVTEDSQDIKDTDTELRQLLAILDTTRLPALRYERASWHCRSRAADRARHICQYMDLKYGD